MPPRATHPDTDDTSNTPLRSGSLFSGYGGLGLAVEELTGLGDWVDDALTAR